MNEPTENPLSEEIAGALCGSSWCVSPEYARKHIAALEQELRDANTANADAAARSVAVEVREAELARLREAVKVIESCVEDLHGAVYNAVVAAAQGKP